MEERREEMLIGTANRAAGGGKERTHRRPPLFLGRVPLFFGGKEFENKSVQNRKKPQRAAKCW